MVFNQVTNALSCQYPSVVPVVRHLVPARPWKTVESPLDNKETKSVNPKGNQPWIFIGRTEAEAAMLWPPDVKNWLTGKDFDAGKDWGQEKKGMTEDDMVGWHHGLDGHEFEWTLGVGDGQGGLECCYSWGCKESDMTERLNWLCGRP